MAPAWLWLHIFVSDPARAHLSRGHAARFGHELTPGSMKAHAVHCSRIQMCHSAAPSILYNPNPLMAYLAACSMRSPPCRVHHLGNAFSTSCPSTSTETHHKPPKRKRGIILKVFQGEKGSSPPSRAISASQRCLCICRSIPKPSPRGSLPYCSLIALLRKRGALTAWLMGTGGTDPSGCATVPQGDPVPGAQGHDNPAAP